ncbi:Uncharacterised protein [Salmonella enterica subsp. enterica serovar Typhi]|nr:Uncharacterised protein [Salmonella enterica subsp. enterica serovar Typhi]
MQKYIFSADKNAFFPVELKIAYQESALVRSTISSRSISARAPMT